MPGKRLPLEERLWPRVDKNAPGGCWVWMGAKREGYGVIWANEKVRPVHRVSLGLAGIEIPEGMVVDHMCRNRACCNPLHLRITTPRINGRENSASPFALNAQRTTCIRGHPKTMENSVSKTTFQCKECSRMRQRGEIPRGPRKYGLGSKLKALEVGEVVPMEPHLDRYKVAVTARKFGIKVSVRKISSTRMVIERVR